MTSVNVNETHPHISPNHYTHVGAWLRDMRQSQRMSLQQASNACRIRTDYITAIEEGKLEDLPGKSYVRGFVKQYALALGLEPDTVWAKYAEKEQWDKDFGVYVPQTAQRYIMPSNIALFCSFLALMVTGVGVYANANSFAAPPAYVQKVPESWWKRGPVKVQVQDCLYQPYGNLFPCKGAQDGRDNAFPWLLPNQPLDNIFDLAN